MTGRRGTRNHQMSLRWGITFSLTAGILVSTPPPFAHAAPATQVNARPESGTNVVGEEHTIGVFAGDANNQTTTATPIRADIVDGSPHANVETTLAEIDCVADNTPGPGVTFPQGQSQTHECAYTGATDGTDTIRVFGDSNNNGAFDAGEPFDDVTKTWSGPPFALDLSPGDSAIAGTCNEFTVRVSDQQGNPVVSQTVDVFQLLQDRGNEPEETRELDFCNPRNAQGPNPTGQGGTAYGDVSSINPSEHPGQPGRNTSRHTEVGPTSTQGEVTFGITINHTNPSENAEVLVLAWVDTRGGEDPIEDHVDSSEPQDESTKIWLPGPKSHGRLIGLRFEHAPGGILVAFGRLTVTDGFNACGSNQAVSVQRRINDRWVTRATTTSNGRGRYAVEMSDRKGKYRAVAARSEFFDVTTEQQHVCGRAIKARRHTH